MAGISEPEAIEGDGKQGEERFLEFFPSKNPNPVLSVGKDGKLLYANSAAYPLLEKWKLPEGEKVPLDIENQVQKALILGYSEELELEAEGRTYLATMYPLPEEGCVNIYGYDISSRKELEKRLLVREKQYTVLKRLGEITLSCKSLQALMNESMRLVARTMEVESCKILEFLPDGNFLLRAAFGPDEGLVGKGVAEGGADSQAGYTVLCGKPVVVEDMRTEKRFKKTGFVTDHPPVSGMSVSIGGREKTFGVIGAHSTKKKDFSEEDVFFLSSVAFLIGETIERRKAEEELRLHDRWMEKLVEERTRELTATNERLFQEIAERKNAEKTLQGNLELLKKLLNSMPNPIYYKDKNGVFKDCNEHFFKQIVGLPKGDILGFTSQEVTERAAPEILKKCPEYNMEFLLENSRKIHREEQEMLMKGETRIFERRHICADGKTRDFLINKSTFGDSNGEITGLLCVMQDISGLKQAEKKLRDNLYFLEKLLDAIPTPVFYKDGESKYRICNEEFSREIVGVPKEQIVGQTLNELFKEMPEELIRVHEEYDLKLLRQEKTQRYEAKLKCATQGTRDFLVNKAPYTDVNGNKKGILGVMFDITEHKRAQETVRKSEERYRLVAEQTGQMVFDYDLDADTIDWAGIRREDIAHILEFQKLNLDSWYEYVHPEDRERVRSAMEETFKKGKEFHEVYRFIKNNGDYIYLEDNAIAFKAEQGRIHRILGVKKDITERKLAVEKVQRSEECLHSFMQNFRGIGFQLDGDFVPRFMHGAAEEITGYSREEFLSGNLEWTDLVNPEDLPLILEKRRKLKSDPELFTELEYRIRRKDGEIRWVREVIQNVPDPSARPTYFQGSIHDITERKVAEEALERTEKIRKKEIHHRIKNNLQVISSLLSLQAETFVDRDVLEAFQESQNRVISMALIHEELYKGSEIDTLDFAAYLRKLTSELLRSYPVANEEVSLELDLEAAHLGMDTAIPLGIIVNELISNSLKHAFPDGGGEIRIELRKTGQVGEENRADSRKINKNEDRNKAAQFSLVVSDNGLGFPESIDFKNTASLGLQLVNTLVEQIEGYIELEKKPGTRFVIRFRESI
nr:PAS domain S-box protein [Methanosarcina sp. KYL-1]